MTGGQQVTVMLRHAPTLARPRWGRGSPEQDGSRCRALVQGDDNLMETGMGEREAPLPARHNVRVSGDGHTGGALPALASSGTICGRCLVRYQTRFDMVQNTKGAAHDFHTPHP